MQEAKRTLEELEGLWTRTPFVIFASVQFFLLLALFAYTRTLSPEWRGFKHWVLDAFCFVGIVPQSWTDCLETPADVLEEFKERVCWFFCIPCTLFTSVLG
jgi:hypothetical protein